MPKDNKKYDFDKDTRATKEYISKHGLGNSNLGLFDQGGFFDLTYMKIKSRSWWVLFVPFHTKSRILEAIEFKYYKPSTPKSAGFELIPLFDYQTTVVFCHKSCMTGDQLTELLHKMTDVIDPSRRITEEKDIIPLLEFNEPETHEWITKLEEYKRAAYKNPKSMEKFRIDKDRSSNKIDGMLEYGIDIRTKNPEVIREIKIYHNLDRLISEIYDYTIKQESGL